MKVTKTISVIIIALFVIGLTLGLADNDAGVGMMALSMLSVLILPFVALIDYAIDRNRNPAKYLVKKKSHTLWKIFGILVILLFAFSLFGVVASSEEEEQKPDVITETETVGEVETEPEPETETEPGAAQETETEPTPVIPEKEILFRDIPWGTNSTTVVGMIEADGKTSTFIWDEMTIPSVEHLFDTDFYSSVQNAGNVVYCYDMNVAGYDVSLANLNFMYSVKDGKVDRSTDELYSAVYTFDVTDHETVYLTLQQKLADLYGEGEEDRSSRKGMIFAKDYSGDYKCKVLETTWKGANDTFVTLRWTSSENEATSVQELCGVMIAYGKSDADSRLSKLRVAIEDEKKEEDRNKSQSGNNDGL